MLIKDIIKAAIPDASDSICEHILWGRTCYPVGKVTAKDLYRAADRFKRATAHSIRLCDFCDNRAVQGSLCGRCNEALNEKRGLICTLL